MIVEGVRVNRDAFTRRTGWTFKPEGACKGDVCVPLSQPAADWMDVHLLSELLSMPLLHDEAADVWCLGPESFGRALSAAEAPDLRLSDWGGQQFELGSLLGHKVLLLAWASW